MYLQFVRFPASLSKSLQLTRHPILCEFSNCALSYISFHIHCNWLVLRSFWILNCLTKSFKSDSFFGGFWQDQSFQQASITHIWSECKKSFDQNVQYWEPFTRWPFHFSWIKIKTLRLGKKTNMIFSQCPSISRCQVRWCHCVSTSAATLPWAGGGFLFMQRLTSNWIIEETTREKPLSPKFNLPFEKNGNKKFFDPPEKVCSQKNGVIDGSWQEFLAQIFPLHCRLIPESFMLMCSKEKKVC